MLGEAVGVAYLCARTTPPNHMAYSRMSAKEKWKDIEGAAGKYCISNCGNVVRVSDYLLKPTVMQVGYLKVSISLEGKVKQRYVHSLVAERF